MKKEIALINSGKGRKMANEFQSIQSGSPELKDYYDSGTSPLQEALKRRRRKLAETELGPYKEQDEEDLSNGS